MKNPEPMGIQDNIDAPWESFNVTEERWKDWNWQYQNPITTASALSEHIHLTGTQKEMIDSSISSGKKMRITPYYLSLMGKNPTNVDNKGHSIGSNVNHIFLQSVPVPAHYILKAGYEDPMGEDPRSFFAVYERYPDRVLLKANPSSACHTYCTHCQRGRDMSKRPDTDAIEKGLHYIEKNKAIKEVIVSGGDSMALPLDFHRKIIETLSGIDHIKSVREATRLPVTDPFAITEEKLEIDAENSLHGKGKGYPNIYFVTHFNSSTEITQDSLEAIGRIKRYGFDIRNQTVLLKGINDDFSTMSHLQSELHQSGVIPYYILQCHNQQGLASKIVPINIGEYIIFEMRGQMGTSIPRYAVNMVGGGGKVDLTPSGDHGFPDFTYQLSREMRTWDNNLVKYEEMVRIRESEFRTGMNVMASFYGDSEILNFEEIEIGNGLKTRETTSEKFRPSIIVVDDSNPEKILYVTNVIPPEIMTGDNKCEAMGLYPSASDFGLPGKYIANPSGIKLEDTPHYLE